MKYFFEKDLLKVVKILGICQEDAVIKKCFVEGVTVSADGVKKVKLFKCCVCDYKSGRKDYIKVHVLRHRGLKPFMCNLCEYRTNTKSNLNVHSRSHGNEKRIWCKICGKAYTSRQNLVKHSLVHT